MNLKEPLFRFYLKLFQSFIKRKVKEINICEKVSTLSSYEGVSYFLVLAQSYYAIDLVCMLVPSCVFSIEIMYYYLYCFFQVGTIETADRVMIMGDHVHIISA